MDFSRKVQYLGDQRGAFDSTSILIGSRNGLFCYTKLLFLLKKDYFSLPFVALSGTFLIFMGKLFLWCETVSALHWQRSTRAVQTKLRYTRHV